MGAEWMECVEDCSCSELASSHYLPPFFLCLLHTHLNTYCTRTHAIQMNTVSFRNSSCMSECFQSCELRFWEKKNTKTRPLLKHGYIYVSRCLHALGWDKELSLTFKEVGVCLSDCYRLERRCKSKSTGEQNTAYTPSFIWFVTPGIWARVKNQHD